MCNEVDYKSLPNGNWYHIRGDFCSLVHNTAPATLAKIDMRCLFQVSSASYMIDNETTRTFHDVTLSDLAQIRHFVRETAVTCACETEALDELIVAMDEGVSNIIRHGYKKESGEIKVTVVCGDNALRVILQDWSPGFDPILIPSPDTTLALEERPFGGLGIHMMRAFCDELSYRSDAQNGNELTLLKRFEQ